MNPKPEGMEVVAILILPFSSILILSDESVAKIIGLAPVVEAARVPLFHTSGVWMAVETRPLSLQKLLPTVR